ncbi:MULTISPECIES: hypothetical protein [Rhizobium]|jgi:hypothetical protein|uniref:hypothetical protein n=1 Tax=Rhizobium TaxID=379 RepID=UPI0003665F3A|nr:MULTISPECIES: hypothetical protein [Rhizobium]NDK52215.1 hypothetical protein [Rhizobium laguerreae]
MYQIVSIDMQDTTVKEAVDTIMNGRQNYISKPTGEFELITENSASKQGNGDSQKFLVIVGHGGPDGVSGTTTWKNYCKQLCKMPDEPETIYVVACSTASEGRLFLYGNFARSVKESFQNATVWASEDLVEVPSLNGKWIVL